MAKRKSVQVTFEVPVDPGRSPNRTIGAISVDMRVHWPPHVPESDVQRALIEAAAVLVRRVQVVAGNAPAPKDAT